MPRMTDVDIMAHRSNKKLPDYKIFAIVKFKEDGKSFRDIGKIVGCSKTTAQKYYELSKNSEEVIVKRKGPKPRLSESDLRFLKLISLRDRRYIGCNKFLLIYSAVL